MIFIINIIRGNFIHRDEMRAVTFRSLNVVTLAVNTKKTEEHN